MPTFSNIGLAEPATVTNRVGAVTITRGSTAEQQEILCLGDPDSSNALAAVLGAAPASTAFGAVVRIASGPSSAADFQVRPAFSSTNTDNPVRALLPSSYADHTLRVLQSSAADLNVTVAGYSTTVQVSSLAGPVISRSSAADALVTVYQSTASALLATIYPQSSAAPAATDSAVIVRVVGYSTTVQVSSLAGLVTMAPVSSSGVSMSTDATPASTKQGVIVRQVFPALLSTGATTIGQTSTATILVSSVAALKTKVYAYSVTSTVVTASTCSFRSSNASVLWPLVLGSQSSAITGANLAVAPPVYLFATDAQSPLVFHTPSSGPEFSVAVSYFQEA